MPKRKPVPSATAAIGSPSAMAGTAGYGHNHSGKKRTWPLLGGFTLKSQRQSRKILILGIVAAVLLIAVIIGVAVGMTIAK